MLTLTLVMLQTHMLHVRGVQVFFASNLFLNVLFRSNVNVSKCLLKLVFILYFSI